MNHIDICHYMIIQSNDRYHPYPLVKAYIAMEQIFFMVTSTINNHFHNFLYTKLPEGNTGEYESP